MKRYEEINQIMVRDQVENAAAAVSILPIDWWPQWIAFFLESLQERTGDRGGRFDEVLAQVQTDIQTRIDEGRW